MLSETRHDLALVYVGKRQTDSVDAALAARADALAAEGKLLEVEGADFGVLFQQMDAFVVHGGLGTTVEALRMKKPVNGLPFEGRNSRPITTPSCAVRHLTRLNFASPLRCNRWP